MILYYLLLLSLAFSDQRFFDYRLFGFTVEKYLGLLCFLYALCYLGARKSPVGLWRNWQARIFLLLFVLAGVSWMTLGRAPFQKSMMLIYISQFAFLVSTLTLIDTQKRLRWSLLATIAGVAWASLYALREWQKAIPTHGLGFRPTWSPAGGPDYFANSAILCLPIAYYLLVHSQRRFGRLFLAACMVLIAGAIMVGASRGGLLALVAMGGVVFLQSRGRRVKILLLGSALATVLLISPASPMHRFLKPSRSDISSENDRLALWTAGLHMIETHPLTGIGLDNFKAEVPAYLAPGQHIDFIAHNTYIEICAEVGLPGLGAFLLILALTFKSLRHTRRLALESENTLVYCAASGLLAGLAGFAVGMFFLSAAFLKLLWFAVFLSAALEPLAATTSENPPALERGSSWATGQTYADGSEQEIPVHVLRASGGE